MFVPGGALDSAGKKYVSGGWAWACWCVTDVQRMSLEVMTLEPMCEEVETKQGVPLTVTGVAQVKIMKEETYLARATEQFLGMSKDEITQVKLCTSFEA